MTRLVSSLILRIAGAWILTGVGTLHAENVDPDSSGLHWAWSENTGWADAQPGGPGGSGLHAENLDVSGWLWAANIGWISAHCKNTASCTDVSYGLRLKTDNEKPGWLLLVGKAWSENAGWIVSHCLESDSCDENYYGLRVEAATGLVEGYAWSENLGWLSFSCSNTSSCGKVSFGLQFDPVALVLVEDIFKDSFESSP